MLRCGAGKATINLEGVLPHDGFSGIHDDLCMRALVFENANGSRCCLLSAEETSLRDDASLREAAATSVGCAEHAVWVSVTHTFSAPHVRTPSHLSDDAARERLALDWDACLIWTGMDARTVGGKELGWVSDVEYYPRSGKVTSFFVGDGSVTAAKFPQFA